MRMIIHTLIHTIIPMFINIYMHITLHSLMHMHIRIRLIMHTSTSISIHTHMHIIIHQYIHIHILTNTLSLIHTLMSVGGGCTHSYTDLYTQTPSYTSLFFLKKAVLGIILESNGTGGNGAVSVFKDTQLDLTGRA